MSRPERIEMESIAEVPSLQGQTNGAHDAEALDDEAPAERPSRVEAQAAVPPELEPRPARLSSGGLISLILGQAAPPVGDDGAVAALRTLPRRAAPESEYTDPLAMQQRAQARIELLTTLAADQTGPARSRLLTQAAELLVQQADHERAAAQYAAALIADPNNRLAALQMRRRHLKSRRLQEAAESFKAITDSSADARERCLAFCSLAEIEQRLGAAHDRVRELLISAVAANPDSLLALVLLAQQQWRMGRTREFAATLQTAADLAENSSIQGLLLLEAGRSHERIDADDDSAAVACYREAHAVDPEALGPLLGLLRLQKARGEHDKAVDTLAKLAAQGSDDNLRAEWQRQRGLMFLDSLADAKQALAALRSQQSASGLRALTRAAEAAGERQEHERALEAWARSSGGAVRHLASVEKARARERALAHPDRAADVAADGGIRNDREALRRAALLCGTAGGTPDERRLLREVDEGENSFVCADVVGLDLAAEAGDIPHVSSALTRDVARWAETMRAGALFAALDLAENERARPEYTEHWDSLLRIAHGQPVITRYLAARAGSPEQSARLWLTESVAAYGEHAAYAATNAGRYLEIARQDPTEAYGDALDAVRGYLPAALGLELSARQHSDLLALERVHRELADRSPSQRERAARQVRLGLLNADTDPAAAAHWLGLASQHAYDDAILDEISIRLATDQSPGHRALLLEASAKRQASPAYRRAMQLQAAEAFEDAALWDDAIRLYRALLTLDSEDTFVDCALLTAFAQSGRSNDLADEVEKRVHGCNDQARRTMLLEDLAHVEHVRGRSQRARVLLERVIEANPGRRAIPALRALQRHAMQTADEAHIMQWSLDLADVLEDDHARAAELWLAARACRRLGGDPTQTLLRAEGRVPELWYALELEALAVRTGDRTRLYEALRMQSELAAGQNPLERATYALRAAEVLQAAAPGKAAHDLADALLAAKEHPLAIEQLARLYKTAGDGLAAAETFERAAKSSTTRRRAATLHYTAALLFQDELQQPERAIDNLEAVARVDLLLGDTFGRLRHLYHHTDRNSELLAVLDARLRLTIDPRTFKDIHWERQELCTELGQLHEAKQSLAALLGAEPTSSAALSALAELHVRMGENTAAAGTLLRLLAVLPDPNDRVPVLLRLAGLYEHELRDAERAENALRRALELVPDDGTALERLAWLHARNGRPDAALKVMAQLLEAPRTSNSERERQVVQYAHLLEQLGQRAEGIAALENARRTAPASMTLLRGQTDLLERQGDPSELAAHLARACDAMRTAIAQSPGDLPQWLALCELLRARKQDLAATLVGQTARSLGLTHPDLPALAAQADGPRDRDKAPAFTVKDDLLARLAPRGAITPLRALLGELGYALDAQLRFAQPFEPVASEQAQPLLADVMRAFNIEELELMMYEGSACLPLAESPLRVCAGKAWITSAPATERNFGLTRAIAIAKFDLSLVARSTPERLGLVFNAVRQVVDQSHNTAIVDAAEQARVVAELSRRIRAHVRQQASNLFGEIAAHEEVTPRRLITTTYDAGTRVALAATGDVRAAISCLLRMQGRDPEDFSLEEKLELCRTEPSLRGLIQFAISESYADMRRESAS